MSVETSTWTKHVAIAIAEHHNLAKLIAGKENVEALPNDFAGVPALLLTILGDYCDLNWECRSSLYALHRETGGLSYRAITNGVDILEKLELVRTRLEYVNDKAINVFTLMTDTLWALQEQNNAMYSRLSLYSRGKSNRPTRGDNL